MNLHALPGLLFGLIFAGVAGSFLYRFLKYGGFRGALFGAPIARTVGEVPCGKFWLMRVVLRVHVLGGDDPDKVVGLELVAKSPLSYHTMPMSLSVAEAAHLVEFLQAARAERPA